MISEKVDLGMAPPAVRGRARVQLFDAETGRCSHDESQDNFVSPRFLRAIAKFANHGLFSAMDIAAYQGLTAMNGSVAFSRMPITGIALTDYSGEPDPEGERFIRGRPLAHASANFPGSTEFVGTYNATESVHRFDYHKFVFDFPTSAANGTFQSIYSGFFNSERNGALPYTMANGPYSLHGKHVAGGNVLRDFDTENFYHRSGGDVVKSVGQDIWDLAYGSIPPSEALPSPGSEAPDAFFYSTFIRGGRLYWLHSAAQVTKIISAPLTELSNVRNEKVFDSTWATSRGLDARAVSNIRGMTFNAERNKVVVLNAATSSNYPLGFTFLELDPVTFADGDVFGASHVNSANERVGSYPGERGLLLFNTDGNSTSTLHETAEDGSLFATQSFSGAPVGLLTSDLAWERSRESSAANRYNRMTPAQWFFSRALLDAPVTKTVQNYMKISYEFTFDPPDLS